MTFSLCVCVFVYIYVYRALTVSVVSVWQDQKLLSCHLEPSCVLAHIWCRKILMQTGCGPTPKRNSVCTAMVLLRNGTRCASQYRTRTSIMRWSHLMRPGAFRHGIRLFPRNSSIRSLWRWDSRRLRQHQHHESLIMRHTIEYVRTSSLTSDVAHQLAYGRYYRAHASPSEQSKS